MDLGHGCYLQLKRNSHLPLRPGPREAGHWECLPTFSPTLPTLLQLRITAAFINCQLEEEEGRDLGRRWAGFRCPIEVNLG